MVSPDNPTGVRRKEYEYMLSTVLLFCQEKNNPVCKLPLLLMKLDIAIYFLFYVHFFLDILTIMLYIVINININI